MVLKLYGLPLSTCTRRVTITLAEKGVDYELIPIDMSKGEHKSPEFLAKQPFGKVPVLDDDGFLIYESRAIAKYIAKKYAGQGTKLVPEDLKEYARFEQACSLETSYFDPPVTGIAFEKVFKSMKGLGATDATAVANLTSQLDAALAVYDKILSKQPYLAGENVTLADLFHLPYGEFVIGLGYGETWKKYPNVQKWWEKLKARESWTATASK